MFQIMRILHELGHRISFIPDNLIPTPHYSDALRMRGIEVLCHPHIESVGNYLKAKGHEFDIIILSRCETAGKHIDSVRLHAPQSRVIFDTVDLHFLREQREATLIRDPNLKATAEETRTKEYKLVEKSDETWVVSECEQRVLQSDWPSKSIQVVSNVVDAPGSTRPFSERRDILFIGSFPHPPNIDAVLFFVRDIFPLVLSHLPEMKFFIIGDQPPPAIAALAGPSIIVTGYLPDVRSYFDSVKLSVAPLRFGAGVKGKINQSMGLGVPVVATSTATEGMSLREGEEVLIADIPEEFANKILELYQSEELWNRLSCNGVEKTRILYSWETAQNQLSRILQVNSRRNSLTRTDAR
jgi:glycosyltransferase involved in cell wall biosynthesis